MQRNNAITLMICGPLIAAFPLIMTFAIIAVVSILRFPGWQGIWDMAILAGMGLLISIPAGTVVLIVGIAGFFFFKSKPTQSDARDLMR
ncbi:hypothetical protein [Asticcacaulis taihuensis]|uniref:Uncharacterized protein n=1 Tax=Asticcacaulis taihuensis TaxID=260084 RepID=A0A1G4TQZ9_9CAUL|nr:hypothetical protein [Asticcacaulis taihuensis]SCW83784.1 hypothetical protein SAMN02927928_0103 [Asticcacaulis taihuensis]